MAIGWRSVAASFAPSITWLVMSAIADLSITGCLVYTLTKVSRIRLVLAVSWVLHGDVRPISKLGGIAFKQPTTLSPRSCEVSDSVIFRAPNGLNACVVAIETGLLTTLCTLTEAILFYVSYVCS